MSGTCAHEACHAHVEVVKIEEYAARRPEHRVAEIVLTCTTCGARASWLGVRGGLSPSEPMAGVSGELRAPFVFEQNGEG